MRAKMYCQSVTKSAAPNGDVCDERVRLFAVYGKDGSANAQWSKATPSGNVELTITNPAAFGNFKPGAYYFLDFTETTEET